VAETRASALVGELEEHGATGAIVGEVAKEPGVRVTG
jgi:hypothetical protein